MKTLKDFQRKLDEPQGISCKPVGVSPADWIKSTAMPLFFACSYNGVAECIMSVLRAMEIWAKDNGKRVEDVFIADVTFVHGDLVVTFK